MEKDELKKRKKEFINNHINRAQINKLFVDSLTLSNFGSILNEPIIDFGALVITLSILKDSLRLMKEYIIYYWNNYNLDNSYHKKDDYKKLKVLYEEYVKNIANYFKKIGLNDIISIATYFSYLVKQSGLSCTNEFELKNVNDIYKEMGFESKCLIVKSYRTNFSNSLLRFFKYLNHAVVLVKTYKGNIIVDPTNNVFGNINDKKTGTKNLITLNGEKKRYKLDFSCSFDGKYVLNIEDDKLMKENNRLLIHDEIKAATKLTDQVKQRVPLYKFKEKNKELIKELNDAVIKIKS